MPQPAAKSTGRDTPVEGFAVFWSAYPRKVGKRDAVRAYGKAVEAGASPDVILAGLTRQLPDFEARPPDKVPHPSTWLNGARWEDEPCRRGSARVPISGFDGLPWYMKKR